SRGARRGRTPTIVAATSSLVSMRAPVYPPSLANVIRGATADKRPVTSYQLPATSDQQPHRVMPMTPGTRVADTVPDPLDAAHISAAGWRIVLLASLGGTLEFYDFVIFGIFAKDIADAIFPNQVPIVSLMVSFATFAVGYLARPIGGIVLSHFGDRYGRRRV